MSEIAKHWIDGEWVGLDTVSESVNPATGAVLGRWADGGEAEARAAIAAARRAFESSAWSRNRSLRYRALNEMADRFDAHAEELGTLVTKENGKKIAEGMFEGTSPSPTLRHTAAQALTDTGISAEVAPGQWFSTYAEPVGVVGIIVPELPRRPAHPVPGSCPVRGEHCRGQDARADRARRQPGLADHRRGHVAAPRRGQPFHRIRQHRVLPTWSPHPTSRSSATPAARANATEYGLAAGIFTSNINISRRVSREIHASTIWTNTWAAINDGFAEGGYKSKAASAACAAPWLSQISREPRPSSTPFRRSGANPPHKAPYRRTRRPTGIRCHKKENDMSASPIEVVGQWLQDLPRPRCRQQRGCPGRRLRLTQHREHRAQQDHAVGRHLAQPRRSSAISARCSPAGKTRRST